MYLPEYSRHVRHMYEGDLNPPQILIAESESRAWDDRQLQMQNSPIAPQ